MLAGLHPEFIAHRGIAAIANAIASNSGALDRSRVFLVCSDIFLLSAIGLRTLKLSTNNVDAQGCRALFDVLCKFNPLRCDPLRSKPTPQLKLWFGVGFRCLSLVNNPFTSKGAEYVAKLCVAFLLCFAGSLLIDCQPGSRRASHRHQPERLYAGRGWRRFHCAGHQAQQVGRAAVPYD